MNMTIHCGKRPLGLALTLALAVACAGAGAAASQPDDKAMAPAGRDAKTLYWQAHDELKHARWEQALLRFVELEERLRRDEPKAVDSAIYWQAYAQAKARQVGAARGNVERLRREFPASRWIEQADQLVAPAAGAAPAETNEDLVEIALDGLLSAPPERALPLVRRVLEGSHTAQAKRRALFVLSQLGTPEAAALLVAQAKSATPELREEAVSMLAVSGDPAALAALDELYRGSTDVEVRRRVLAAWMIAGNQPAVLQVALNDADPDLRRDAVHQLGAMGAKDELKSLLANAKDEATLAAVVQALGISGDTELLAELVGSARPEPIRIQAMHALGVAGASERLLALYPNLDTAGLRDAALQGLLIGGDSKALMQLYRQARGDDEKRAILRMLTVMGDDAALDAIEATINESERAR